MNPYAAQIYIDGSCLRNPGGAGGFAGILEMPDSAEEPVVIFQKGRFESTTNNRMEMRALIESMKWIKNNASKLRSGGVNEVEVWSDSDYTLNCYKCGEVWRTKGWVGSEGVHVRNPDLIKQIISLKNSIGFSCKPQWVQNKSSENTKRVDKLAKAAAEKFMPIKDVGFIKPRVSKTSVSGATHPFDAHGQKMAIRIFEHGSISSRKDSMYRVKFEILVNGNIEKYFAYTTADVDSLLHRWHYYDATFGDNAKKPKIERVNEIEESDFTPCD